MRGAAFERVELAFRALGYDAPAADAPGNAGAYASNIAAQYAADLTEDEALAVIDYGLSHDLDALKDWAQSVGTRHALRLDDVLARAQE